MRQTGSRAAFDPPIAIVGMSCRFPGAADLESYRRILVSGADCVGPLPSDRWEEDPSLDAALRALIETGGFIERVYDFDPEFFGISSGEALQMDPQQRLLLELAQEALDDASLATQSLKGGENGVFIGASTLDAMRALENRHIDASSATGLNQSILSARLSYLFDWHGPAVTCDTACSSGLVALLSAARSLAGGECDLALAGAVNLMLDPSSSLVMAGAGVLAPGGRCRPFDAAADGIVRAEGGGILILKRLDDALADGDRVHAVLRAGAMNQDGRSAHLMAPNTRAQTRLLERIYGPGGIAPASVDYVEAHGTGTALGDPIEARALGRVLGQADGRQSPLGIGSVKGNLGHSEAVAGIAGVIKSAIMLSSAAWPASLHFETGNQHIDFAALGLEVIGPRVRRSDPPRRIGVNAFGFGGTNAHVVLERSAPGEPVARSGRSVFALISAPTVGDLARQTRSLADFLERNPALMHGDLAATLARRTRYRQRLALPFFPGDRAIDATLPRRLRAAAGALSAGTEPAPPFQQDEAKSSSGDSQVVFLYSGTGEFNAAVGARLAQRYRVFQQSVEECETYLYRQWGFHLSERLARVQSDPDQETIHAALIVFQIALTDLWQDFGLRPAAVIGQSVGEIAAAYGAGILSRQEALRVLVQRSAAIRSQSGKGAMLVTSLEAAEAEDLLLAAGLAARVSVAAVNGPKETVLSGAPDAMERCAGLVAERGERSRLLEGVLFASHSPAMDEPARVLRAALGRVATQPARVSLFSTLDGRPLDGSELQAEYWARNLREPVRAYDAVRNAGEYFSSFLEIGPGAGLARTVEAANPAFLYSASLRSDLDELTAIESALARLACAGCDQLLESARGAGRVISLPVYQFDRRELRLAPLTSTSAAVSELLSRVDGQTAQLELEIRAAHPDLDLGRFHALCDELARVSIAVAVQKIESGKRPVLTHFAGLYRRWLEHLGIARAPERRDVSPVPSPAFLERERLRLEGAGRAAAGDALQLFEYLEHSGRALAELVCGERSALDILFPDGSYRVADAMYRRWPPAQFFNSMIARVVRELASLAEPGRPLRILEVGAGTGATTASLVEVLSGTPCEYYFTDLSELFLERAREEFAGFDFLRYRRLDLETPFETQHAEFAANTFDLVVATNVVHAVSDLDLTLGYLRQALQHRGLLLLNEMTEYGIRFDASTALVEGWQKFRDRWREDIPLLEASSWQSALVANGFQRAALLPGDSPFAVESGQTLICAFCDERRFALPGRLRLRSSPAPDLDVLAHRGGESDLKGSDEPRRIGRSVFNNAGNAGKAGDASGENGSDFICRALQTVLPDLDVDLHRELPLQLLGFDSLMGVELRGKIRRSLGIEFTPADFSSSLSLDDLIHFVEARLRPEAPARAGDTQSAIRRLQAGKHKMRVVIVHPGGLPGSVYRDLLPAFAGHSVYFLQPEELNAYHRGVGGDQLKTIAARSCAELAEQFTGPLLLLGWSLGGFLSLKIAEIASGVHSPIAPAGVILLDSANGPGSDAASLDRWFALYRKAHALSPGAGAAAERLRAGYEAGVRRAYELIEGCEFQAGDVPLWLIEAEEFAAEDRGRHPGLRKIFADATRYVVAGDHYSMLQNAGGAGLLEIFARILSECGDCEFDAAG
ncbi:MAG: acyltransferase domain-containing protein [bacterium]|nr:acyltransferase domain-containing protein [bacterium]